MFVVHNLAELSAGLVMPVSPPFLPLFSHLNADRTEIVQGTRVSRTLKPQKKPLTGSGEISPVRQGKRRCHEANASAAHRLEVEDVFFYRAAHVITHCKVCELGLKAATPLIGANGRT